MPGKVSRGSQAASQQVTTGTMQASTTRAAGSNLPAPMSSNGAGNINGIRGQSLSELMGYEESADENDEENIVIDMCDEDEDEDYDQMQDRREMQDQLEQEQEQVQDRDENHNDSAKIYAKHQRQLETNHPQVGHIGAITDGVSNFGAGDLVWFDPNQLGYSIPGKVLDVYPDMHLLTVEGYAQPNDLDMDETDLEAYNRLLLAADQQLQVYDLSDPLQLSSIKHRLALTQKSGKPDLIQLEELSLESIIWNLKLRYKQDMIYTNCGSKILLSVNPFKQLNNIYDLDQANKYDSFHSSKLRSLGKFRLLSSDSSQSNYSKLLRWLILNDGNFSSQPETIQQSTINKEPPTAEECHIFGLANRALMKLLISGQDQCFVLLGESGSGKTEVSKLLVQYFASINKSPTNLMTEQILESVQVLESFGNAKTIHNDNSSRFGKLLEIEFSLVNGFILNAKTIDLNLLDRSRIVSQVNQERNYHVFYELLAGLSSSEKEKYGLQTAEKYFYVNQGNCIELQTKEDGEDFRTLLASLQVLGFNYEEQDTIFRVLASVLHLGNIYFHRKVLAVRSGKLASAEPAAEGVEVGSDTEVRWISHLLQIQFDAVMRCLSVRTTEISHLSAQDKIVTPLNIDQALDTRDAIARTLYNCLFKWLVQRINVMISAGKAETSSEPGKQDAARQAAYHEPQSAYGLCRTSESLCEFQPDKLASSRESSTLRQRTLSSPASSSSSSSPLSPSSLSSSRERRCGHQQLAAASISILDSFGFENLHENNFEQLCINYSAELLHYHTSRYLLRLEQGEYTKERLKWSPVGTSDLQPGAAHLQLQPAGLAGSGQVQGGSYAAAAGVVNLLSKKPLGILALLDDECNFPKATDQSFVEKCHHNHTLNENYQRARLGPNCSQEFGVRHFRQQTKLVWYQVEGFIEKNRDAPRADILDLLLSSKMSIVADIIRKQHRSQTSQAGGPALDKAGSGNGKTLSRTYDGRYVSMKPRATTVAARFQDTLQNNKVLDSINPRIVAATPANSLQLRAKEHRSQVGQSGEPGEPWFIVCLKPNRSRTSALFDVSYVQEQVISMNVHEIAQIRQRGYPFKMRFNEFIREYMCLVPSRFLSSLSVKKGQIKRGIRDVCKSIVEYSSGAGSTNDSRGSSKRVRHEFQCGLTKVFLSERLHQQLEKQRLSVHLEAVCLLQKTIRMWLAKSNFIELRNAATIIQAHWRAFVVRREFWRQYMLIVCLQRRWRQQLHLRRLTQLEQERKVRRKQQLVQLRELQKEQQVNQFRFRQQPSANQAAGNYVLSSLDIPHDLGQLYRLQRDWMPVHHLSHLQEVKYCKPIAGETPHLGLAKRLDMDNRYDVQEFLLKFYTKDSPQFGYSRLAITRPFDWPQLVKRRKLALKRAKRHSDPITRNELIMSLKERFDSVRSNSVALYKLILRYIDSDSSRIEKDNDAISASQKLIKFKLLADYVIYLCIEEPLLRDEVFLQLASLSWQNPKQKSVENCWRFMLNCLSCFGPESRSLTKYLLRYTMDNCCYEKYRETLLAKLTYYLSNSHDTTREFPPSMLEYRAYSCGIPNLALSAWADHYEQVKGAIVAPVESHTTSQEFARMVLQSLRDKEKLSEQSLFGWTMGVVASSSADVSQESPDMIPCQLRGDRKLLDHFSGLELQPEFVQQILESRAGLQTGGLSATNLGGQSDYETIAPTRHLGLGSDRELANESRQNLTAHYQKYARPSSELDLSPGQSQLGPTNRSRPTNRRHLMQQQQQQHYNSNDNQYNQVNYDAHYDEPQHVPMTLTSKGQFNRRSMSMEGLQWMPRAPNGRHLNQTSGHYACSPSFANEPRRSQTPTCSNQQRISSSAYGSESYQESLAAGQHYYQQTGSLSRDVCSARRPRRSASSSNFQLAPGGHGRTSGSRRIQARLARGNYHSDYASACCSDYERIPSSTRGQQFVSRPLPTPSASCNSSTRPMQVRRLEPAVSSFKPKSGRARGGGGGASAGEPQYLASSAMSDTSEAPSLASHVRAVKVPQANGDLDQYLDALFKPMLDDELDLGDMSDSRSLAPSMRGHSSRLLENLCDAKKLSKIIRGRDPDILEDTDDRKDSLSPTFESLLTSLRQGDGGVRKSGDSTPLAAPIGAHQLGEINLSQLRALNEKLESEIIAQASLGGSSVLLSDALPTALVPKPPPQPNFEALKSDRPVSSCTLVEDLYDRAKTIRVGKVRWPPQQDEQASLGQAQVKQGESEEPSADTEPQVEGGQGKVGSPDSVTIVSSSVGKLKISSEMKAKLEQLTNSANSGDLSSSQTQTQTPTPTPANKPHLCSQDKRDSTGSGIVSQAKSSLMASSNEHGGQVKQLALQRKHLLESQLLGHSAPAQHEGGDNRNSFGGSKVMAVKQQLAAAAGVALALLDSSSACNIQAAFSSQPAGLAEAAKARQDLQADELGPQSRSAISQRLAFYQQSASEPASGEQVATVPEVGADEPVAGSEETQQAQEPATNPSLPAPPPPPVSSDNLAGQVERPSQVNRAVQISSELNEAGIERPHLFGQANERLYGQSVTLALAQHQKEKPDKDTQGESRDWIASSPDPLGRPGYLAAQSESSNRKRPTQRASDGQQTSLAAAAAAAGNRNSGKRAPSGYQQQEQQLEARRIVALTYANVDWRLTLRKEFFLPSESYENPLVLQLIFGQLVSDAASGAQLQSRLSGKERAAIRSMLKDSSIDAAHLPGMYQMEQVKREAVKLARSFGLYFTRSYEAQNYALLVDEHPSDQQRAAQFADLWRKRTSSVSGDDDDDDDDGEDDDAESNSSHEDSEGCEANKDARDDDLGRGQQTAKWNLARKLLDRLRNANNLGLAWIDLVAVHHSGLRLVLAIPSSAGTPTQQQQQQRQRFGYKVLETLKYRDMTDVSLVGERELLVSMRNGRKCWLLSSDQVSSFSR